MYIIFCSSDIEKIRRDCIDAEINDFISRPVARDQLLEVLECWLPSYLWKQNVKKLIRFWYKKAVMIKLI
jgi:hypothetical protein